MNINYDSPFNFKPIASITPASDYWQNGTWKFNMPEITVGTAPQPSWQDIILSGNTALTLVNAKENGLNYLKLFGGTEQLPEQYLDTVTLSGGCEQRNLPSGYTQVEYIESDGTAWLDTDFIANGGMIFDGKVMPIGNELTIGSISPLPIIPDTTRNLITYTSAGGGDYIPQKLNKYTTTYADTGTSPAVIHLDTTGTKFYCTVNGNEVVNDTTNTLTNQTTTVKIGFSDYSGTTRKGRYYPLQFRNSNGDLVRDLVPAKNSSNVVSMYDKVTDTFLPVQGTGTFTAGADVVVPSPTTPMDIISNNGVIKVSPNLFDRSQEILNYYLNPADGQPTPESSSAYLRYIHVSPNTEYTISFVYKKSGYYMRIHGYASNQNWNSLIWQQSSGTVGTVVSNTFTTGANDYYLGISYPKQDTDIQLEAGSLATDYMAYGAIYADGTQEVVTDSVGNTASAEMLLAVGDYKDTQEVLSGSVTRNIGIKILDGSENWQASDPGYFLANVFSGLSSIAGSLCTHFTVTNSNSHPYDMNIDFGGIQPNNLFVRYDAMTTLSNFKQFLADQYAQGTPVIIVYPISSATTSTVSGQFLSKSPVTQTAGSISNLPIAITESSHTTPTPQQPLQINCNNGVVKAFKTLNISTYDTTPSGAGIDITFDGVTDRRKWNTLNDGGTGTNHYENGFVSIYMDSPGNSYFAKALVDGVVYNGSVYNTGEQIDSWAYNTTKNIDIYCPTINTDGTVETVEATGKNLFNVSDYNEASDWHDAPYSYVEIPLPNGTYTVSWDKTKGAPSIYWVIQVTESVVGTANVGSGGSWLWHATVAGLQHEKFTFTVTKGKAWFSCAFINFNNFLAMLETVQIELGSTATTYEPYYYGGTATAEDLFKIGTYQDEQSVLDGGVIRNVGIKIFDGSETIRTAHTTTYYRYICDNALSNGLSVVSDSDYLCSHFGVGGSNPKISVARGTEVDFWFDSNTDLTDTTKFKQWLADQYNAGFPVIVVYPLATATTETVTAQPLIIQEGTNIVEITQASMDSLPLEVSYKAGVAVTITEVENANLSNSVTVTIGG